MALKSIEFTAKIKEIVVKDKNVIAVIGKKSKALGEGVNIVNDDYTAAVNVIKVLVSYTLGISGQILKGGRCSKRNKHWIQVRNHMLWHL